MGIEAGVGRERSREQDPPHECPFGMLTRTITRVQFASPSSHGAGSGLCSARLQHIWALYFKINCNERNQANTLKNKTFYIFHLSFKQHHLVHAL